jgi:long-chain fatty acid transport protein
MARSKIRKTALSLAVAGAFAGGVSQAHASGFALIEQNVSGLGNAYAGAAAVAEDASTVYYNPAGMSALPGGTQFVVGTAVIQLSAKFHDGGSSQSGLFATFGGPFAGVTAPLGGDGGNAGGAAAVPNFYLVMDVAKDTKFGLGVSAPFGLKTEYSPDWVGRFQAIKSDIKTLNVNPSLSFDLGSGNSIGIGLNYQQIDVEFTNKANVAAAALGAILQTGAVPGLITLGQAVGAAAGLGEATADVKASDSYWGWNIGGLFRMSPDTRLGLTYRSEISYNGSGTVNFSNVGLPGNLPSLGATGNAIAAGVGANLANGNVNIRITLPESLSAALMHRLNDKWTLLGDATFTAWSRIQALTIVRENGTTLGNTPENFKDTWRLGAGATYRYSDALSLKMGVAYDQTPVNDTDRTARLPDQNRTWLAFGGQYRLSKAGTLDAGYAHLFIKDAPINQNGGNATLSGQLVGTYKGSVDIFGAQFAYRF